MNNSTSVIFPSYTFSGVLFTIDGIGNIVFNNLGFCYFNFMIFFNIGRSIGFYDGFLFVSIIFHN